MLCVLLLRVVQLYVSLGWEPRGLLCGPRTARAPLPRRAKRVGHALDGVLALCDKHDGYAGDLADAALQVTIARRHDKAAVLRHTVH